MITLHWINAHVLNTMNFLLNLSSPICDMTLVHEPVDDHFFHRTCNDDYDEFLPLLPSARRRTFSSTGDDSRRRRWRTWDDAPRKSSVGLLNFFTIQKSSFFKLLLSICLAIIVTMAEKREKMIKTKKEKFKILKTNAVWEKIAKKR